MLESLQSVSLVLWTLVLTPVIYVVYNLVCFVLDVRRRGKAVDQFPGEPKHWLWGHLHLGPQGDDYFGEKGFERDMYLVTRYPEMHTSWDSSLHPSLCLTAPNTVKAILKTSEPKPRTLGMYRLGKDWIGDGLITTWGKKWARTRRLLTPAFHFDILKPYVKVNNEVVEILLDKISKSAAIDESFEFFNNISLMAFDVILRCAFSYEDDIQIRDHHPYVEAVCELGDLWIKRAIKPWLYPDFMYYLTSDGRRFRKNCHFVHDISENVIKKRQKILEEVGEEAMRSGRYIDFLDILLTCKDEDGKGLTVSEIRDEVDTFMFAGHDTTSSSMAWTLFSLAGHPHHQRECQAEIDEILSGRDADDILWDDLPKLPYLTRCIKEAMRLHSPVPYIERITTKEMTIDGVKLPPNSVLSVQLYNLHHNPQIWEQPMEYQPDRFLPENVEKKDTYAFIPFSAGPRNCIGQNFAMHEQKVVIARILRQFDLALDPDFKVEKKIGVVMKTQNGMKLKVKQRNI